jgi:uncharacterized protein
MHAGLGYHQLHRGGPRGWWRPVLGVVLLLIGMFVLGGAVFAAAVLLEAALAPDFMKALEDPFDDPGPVVLAGLLGSLAILIPVAVGISWLLHGVRPGFLTSVAGRVRWGYLLSCLGLSVVALLATVVVGSRVPSGMREELAAEPNPVDFRFFALLLVVALVTPFQAAGEEYVFRGYLTQAFGGLLPTAFAVVGPAVLFALAHGAQSPPIFIDRLAFGLIAGVLVVLTGGLEAGIAMHVLNNWLAFGIALAFGDMSSTLNPTGGTWWSIPVTLTQSVTYLLLAWWMARRMGLANRSDPAVLAAPDARV